MDEIGHRHVYGANLAVRLDAYDRVGGFRGVLGEDQDLVDRLRAAGEPVLATYAPLVSTSARTPGRAEGGLGSLLQRLGEDERAECVVARPDPTRAARPEALRAAGPDRGLGAPDLV